MIDFTLYAALFSLVLTLFVLWVNPYRFSNQAFALVLLVQTAWLGCVYRAMQVGASTTPDKADLLEWWFRANAAVISFLPPTMWLLKCAITAQARQRRKAIYQSLPLFALSMVFIALCSTQSFVYQDSLEILHRGASYYIFSISSLIVYCICILDTFRLMGSFNGIRKLELQFLALNAGGAALLLLGLNAVGNLLENRAYNRLSIPFIFAASALTACALLRHRVFNAWEVLLQLVQRLWFACILTGGIYCLWLATTNLIAEPFGLLISVAVFSPVAVWLDKKTRAWFDVTGEQKLEKLRQYAIETAHNEPKTDELVRRFEAMFCAKFDAQSAFFLFDRGPAHAGNGVVVPKHRKGHRLLCELGWATPETLDRRRSTPAVEDLKQFLEENSLGLVVPIPRGSTKPSLLLALAMRPDDRPYTFPEIERIRNLTELMDSILIRSKLTTQAALNARTEYLNMMSRGLAHDLKNLLTPVSTFLIHTNNWFRPNSIEGEVHAAATGAMHAVVDYVRETLSFSERLEPNFQRLKSKELCDSVLSVTSAHATRRGVRVIAKASDPESMIVDGVLIQRMLGNLVSNAVDASASGQAVSLTINDLPVGWVRFQVRDDGCGIPAEHLCRVLDPYFTTKGINGDVRGFGLGLTIVQKIVHLHGGTVDVQSKSGQHTIVTVDLPTAPSSQVSVDLADNTPNKGL